MSILSLRLPDSLHRQVKELAKKDGVSMNQFISSAVAEKMSALLTEELLKRRAAQGDEKAFLEAMRKVPEVPAEDHDKLDEV